MNPNNTLFPQVLIFASLLLSSLEINANELLVKSGKTDYTIILPDDATGGETYAATELKHHINQISGAELTQTSESIASPDKTKRLYIGRTAESKKHIDEAEFTALGDDGYKVFTKDETLFFIGGRQRGSIYAVYEYLESLGVRWYATDYAVIPKNSDIVLPTKPIAFKPKFWYRSQWWNNQPSLEWLARMRVNGNTGQTPAPPDSMGGSIIPKYTCHSYKDLVPESEFFATHPEWYSRKEDKNRNHGSLCTTNPELRDYVTSKVLTDLRASTESIEHFWISQNDGGQSGCFCEDCTKERQAHGGPDRWSANNVSFVSAIANNVKSEFPRVHIKSLAYSYTQPAPENMTTPQNVLIEICGNFKHGETSHTKLVDAWSKVAKNISVYTYGGSNYGYWWPFPNLVELGMQYPRALQSGVTAFYVQGTALGKGSGLVELRAYLTARLAWDPSRDVQKEISDFCEGFYGPGGKPIVEYILWYGESVKTNKLPLYDSWGDAEAWRVWVNKEAMIRADAMFQKALAATKDTPTYHKHVRRAYLEILWAQVMLDMKPGAEKPDLIEGADPNVVRTRAKLFGEIMRENNYDKLAEYMEYVPGKNPIDAAAEMPSSSIVKF